VLVVDSLQVVLPIFFGNVILLVLILFAACQSGVGHLDILNTSEDPVFVHDGIDSGGMCLFGLGIHSFHIFELLDELSFL